MSNVFIYIMIAHFVTGLIASILWHIHQQPNKITLGSLLLVFFGTLSGFITAIVVLIFYIDENEGFVLWERKQDG